MHLSIASLFLATLVAAGEAVETGGAKAPAEAKENLTDKAIAYWKSVAASSAQSLVTPQQLHSCKDMHEKPYTAKYDIHLLFIKFYHHCHSHISRVYPSLRS